MAITRLALTKSEYYPGVPTVVPLMGAAYAAVTSGDLVIGDGLALTASTAFVGIAQSDYVNATTPIGFMIEGAVNIPVHAETAASVNQIICVGDPLYWSAQSVGDLKLDHGPGTYVGRALEYVASGAEATIGVLLSPRTAPAISNDTTYYWMTFPLPPLASLALNELHLDGFVFGHIGTIVSAGVVGTVDATTAADIELTFTIAGAATTGGVIALTHTNVNEGDWVAGTAITADNAFTAAQEINIKVTEATTPFTEGEAYVMALIGMAHDHA